MSTTGPFTRAMRPTPPALTVDLAAGFGAAAFAAGFAAAFAAGFFLVSAMSLSFS
jgi:hypothetical protein